MPASHCDACRPATGGHVLQEVDGSLWLSSRPAGGGHRSGVRSVSSDGGHLLRSKGRRTPSPQKNLSDIVPGCFGHKSGYLSHCGRKQLHSDLASVSELYADAAQRSERLESVWEKLESKVLGESGLLQETETLAFERARYTNALCEEHARREQESTNLVHLKAQLRQRELHVEELRLRLATLEKQLASKGSGCRAAWHSLEKVERLSDRSCEHAELELEALTNVLQEMQSRLRLSRERSLALSDHLGLEEKNRRELMETLSELRGEAAERRNAMEVQEDRLETREKQLRQVQQKAQRLEKKT